MEIEKEYGVCEGQVIRKKVQWEDCVESFLLHLPTECPVMFSLADIFDERDKTHWFSVHRIVNDMLAYSYTLLMVDGMVYDSNSMDNRH